MADLLVIAGETSGEEHAMSFLPQLLQIRPDVQLWGVGGDRLQALGMRLNYHLRDFSSMGLSEVVGKIPFYRSALKAIETEAVMRGTQHALLVDFQDFNLRLATRLKKRGIKIWYYVAPQAWAWRPGRAGVLANTVERLFTILPFEEAWFHERGVRQVTPVPHPLVKTWSSYIQRLPKREWESRLQESPRLIVLPGSRMAEVMSLLPVFLQSVREIKSRYPKMHITLSYVPHLGEAVYEEAREWVDKWVTPPELPEALLAVDVALAASGTVTLGTGLMGVPTVVAYRSSLLNEFIYNQFVRYRGAISLTNLVLEAEVFPEFTQQRAQSPLLTQAVLRWLEDPAHWAATTSRLARLPGLLTAGEQDVGGVLAREMK